MRVGLRRRLATGRLQPPPPKHSDVVHFIMRYSPRFDSLGAFASHYRVERRVELALLVGGRRGRLGPLSRRAFFGPSSR